MLEKQPGRPLGPIAESVLELLAEKSPLTAREIAFHLQLNINIAEKTCSRLKERNRIRVVKRERISRANKPVSKYALVRQISNQATFSTTYFRI